MEPGHLLELAFDLLRSRDAGCKPLSYLVWQRSLQRILGTFLGLGPCWLLLGGSTSPVYLCICIMVLQLIVEMLVVRQYALAVIFITPLTIFLGSCQLAAAGPDTQDLAALPKQMEQPDIYH